MARTRMDRPYRLGGDRHRYSVSSRGHAQFKRNIRRRARARAKQDLGRGNEPEPDYPVNHEYFD